MRIAVLAILLALACSKTEFPQKAPEQRTTSSLQEYRNIPFAEQEPVRVGGNVTPPVVIRRVEPKFPEARRTSSFLTFEVVITKSGDVKNVRSLKSPDDAQTRAVIDALRQWKFSPGRLRGEPVDVIYNFSVNIDRR